jgi:hypothetical protein
LKPARFFEVVSQMNAFRSSAQLHLDEVDGILRRTSAFQQPRGMLNQANGQTATLQNVD